MSNLDSNHNSSPLRVTITIESRTDLLDMMNTLDEADINVQTDNISRLSLDNTRSARVNFDNLTEKQRNTLEIALEMGYYERPRKADLTDLSDQIDISKSAVSQRLRTAEAKLIKDAFDIYK